jgi:hypothetical protein
MTADGDRSIGVIRRHASIFAASPRPRLRAALGRALRTLEERLGRSRVRRGDHPIDFTWNRPSPLVLLRENRRQEHWRISAALLLNVASPPGGHTDDVPVRAAAPRAHATAIVPRLTRILEERTETRIVEWTRPVLGASANRSAVQVSNPVASMAATPPPSQPLVMRADVPIARPEMIVVRSPMAAAVPASPGSARVIDSAGPVPRPVAGPTPPAPALQIERITTEVIRALDARLIARRERMGRS